MMSSEIDLTIIIPHYNIPQLLKKLLDTIPVLPGIQVIVVDDNSTEGTCVFEQIKRDYKHCEFYSNDTGKNSGGTCRNIGLKHAKGRWVIFADADDYFTEGFYETVSKYFGSDYDVVFFPPASVNTETGEASGRHVYNSSLVYNYLQNSSKEHELELKYNSVSPCSKMISGEIITKNNLLFADTIVAEEAVFCAKLAFFSSKITAENSVIYVVTERVKSLTSQAINNENLLFISLGEFINKYNFITGNLSKDEIRILDITGGSFVFNAYKKKYPFRTLFRILIILKKKKVKIIRRRWLNPIHVVREVKQSVEPRK